MCMKRRKVSNLQTIATLDAYIMLKGLLHDNETSYLFPCCTTRPQRRKVRDDKIVLIVVMRRRGCLQMTARLCDYLIMNGLLRDSRAKLFVPL